MAEVFRRDCKHLSTLGGLRAVPSGLSQNRRGADGCLFVSPACFAVRFRDSIGSQGRKNFGTEEVLESQASSISRLALTRHHMSSQTVLPKTQGERQQKSPSGQDNEPHHGGGDSSGGQVYGASHDRVWLRIPNLSRKTLRP